MTFSLTVRPGGRDDVDAVLALLDGATEWLVANGRTDQWGTEPHSTNPRRVEQITGFADDGGLWVAETDGRVVGALAVGDAMSYVPPATEPELYIRLLVTDRAFSGSGIGTDLLDHARALARGLGRGPGPGGLLCRWGRRSDPVLREAGVHPRRDVRSTDQ